MSSQTLSGKSNFNTDPNHIYYNLQVYNNDTTGNSASQPLRFQETRLAPILANPSEYFLSILRFSLDTVSLPLVMPQVETDILKNVDGNPNKLVYQIMFYSIPLGYSVPFNILFIQQDETLPVPTADQIHNDPTIISNPYYFVYTYQNFIDMINRSLLLAMNDFNDVSTTPQIVFNKNTKAYDIWFPPVPADELNRQKPNRSTSAEFVPGVFNPAYGNSDNSDYNFKLFFNQPLFTLFSSLNSEYVGSIPDRGDGWYNVNADPALINHDPALPNFYNNLGFGTAFFPENIDRYIWPTTEGFNINYAEYPSQPLWNPVKQIIFTTALMPIVNQLVGTPLILNSNIALDNPDVSNNFSPILTDIEVDLHNGDETKPNINYVPSGKYRLIDLQSNMPINIIEISIIWKDQYGNPHNFLLEPGCGASIKIMFRKKIYNLLQLDEYTKPV